MKKNGLIVAGKDCEGCECYTFGDDKRVYCHKKDNEADKHFVIIENKFKSLPDKKQLERYEVVCQGKKNKKDNYTFILFAPQDSLRVFEKNRPARRGRLRPAYFC